ncbi:MAG: restriction endonuclease [Armatimonadetes bacterium]|nr:restriction endonuclease [Armatimonadota bacterium]
MSALTEFVRDLGWALPRMWPILAVVVAAALLARADRLWAWWRGLQLGLDHVDALSGEDFEVWLERFYRRAGWQVRRLGGSGDFGCDLIISYGGYDTAVQAKRSSKPVGVGAVQEVVAGRQHHGCHYAMVVTNSSFTVAAVQLAQTCGVELWDRERLAAELERYG